MPSPGGKPYRPDLLLEKNGFNEKLKKTVEDVKRGSSPIAAVRYHFGVSKQRWYEWRVMVKEDVEAGFTSKESNLIKLFEEIGKADMSIRRDLEVHSVDRALDDNDDLLKFLLERRYGYTKKSKKDVEVSTKDDFNFNINIVESKPIDNE